MSGPSLPGLPFKDAVNRQLFAATINGIFKRDLSEVPDRERSFILEMKDAYDAGLEPTNADYERLSSILRGIANADTLRKLGVL